MRKLITILLLAIFINAIVCQDFEKSRDHGDHDRDFKRNCKKNFRGFMKGKHHKIYCAIFGSILALALVALLFVACCKCKRRRLHKRLLRQQAMNNSLMRNASIPNQVYPQQGIPVPNVQGQPQYFAIPADQYNQFQYFLQQQQQQMMQQQRQQPIPNTQQFQQGAVPPHQMSHFEVQQPNIPMNSTPRNRYPFVNLQDTQ